MALSTRPDKMSGENGQTEYTKIYEVTDTGVDWIRPGCDAEVNTAMHMIVPLHCRKSNYIDTNQALTDDTCISIGLLYRIKCENYETYFNAVHKDKPKTILVHCCDERAANGIIQLDFNLLRLHRFVNGKGINMSDVIKTFGHYGEYGFVNQVSTGKVGRGRENVLPSTHGFDTVKNGDIWVVESKDRVLKLFLFKFVVRPQCLSIEGAQNALDRRRVFNSDLADEVRHWLSKEIACTSSNSKAPAAGGASSSKAPAASGASSSKAPAAGAAGGSAGGPMVSAAKAARVMFKNVKIHGNTIYTHSYLCTYKVGNPVYVEHRGVPAHLQRFVDVTDYKRNLAEVMAVLHVNGKAEVVARMADPKQRNDIDRHNNVLRRKRNDPLLTLTDKGNAAISFTIQDNSFRIAMNNIKPVLDAANNPIYTMSAVVGASSAAAPAASVQNNVLNGPFGGPGVAPTNVAVSNGAAASVPVPAASVTAPVAGSAGVAVPSSMKAPVADVSASNVIPAATMRPAAAASKQHGNVQKKAASKEDKVLVYGTTACDFTLANGKQVFYNKGDNVNVMQDPQGKQIFQLHLDLDISQNRACVMNALRKNGKKYLVVRFLEDAKRKAYEKAVQTAPGYNPKKEYICYQNTGNRHVMQDDEFEVYASFVRPDGFVPSAVGGVGGAGGAAPAAVPAPVTAAPVVPVAPAAVPASVVPVAVAVDGVGGAGGVGGAAQSAAPPKVDPKDIIVIDDSDDDQPPLKKPRS